MNQKNFFSALKLSLKAPRFWWKHHPSWLARLVQPLCYPYVWGQKHHRRCFPDRYACIKAPCPVISVGSALMGGSGKTPVTLALIHFLKAKGAEPLVITRGYGGSLSALPTQVFPEKHSFREVGDEALLLARHAPVFVASLRSQALSLMTPYLRERSVILLDDGHQHASLHKDRQILVFHENQKVGNGMVFPAGPLRESLSRACARASAVVSIREKSLPTDDSPLPDFLRAFSSVPVVRATQHVACSIPSGFSVVLFAGVGFPQRLIRDVQDGLGLKVAHTVLFPDHWPYRRYDEQALLTLAEKYGACLLTTEKDFVRLSPAFRRHVQTLSLRIDLSDEDYGVLLEEVCPLS